MDVAVVEPVIAQNQSPNYSNTVHQSSLVLYVYYCRYCLLPHCADWPARHLSGSVWVKSVVVSSLSKVDAVNFWFS